MPVMAIVLIGFFAGMGAMIVYSFWKYVIKDATK